MDDGRARDVSGDTGAPGDLLGALLSDGQLLERVSQIVAKTRAAGSSAADADATAPSVPTPDASYSDTSQPGATPYNAPRPAMPDLSLLAALLGGAPAPTPQDADDNPAVQTGSDSAGESAADTSASGTSGAPGSPYTPPASGAPSAPAASASQSNDPPDRLAGLTSLLTDSDFMAKLPGVLSMLVGGGGGGKDGGNGGSDGKDGKNVPSGARGGHGGGHGGGRGGGDRCIALLSALRPYMSPRRCEAIDYLIRMNRMGDIIRRIR